MGKRKRRLTAAEKAAKKLRKAEFQTVLINGKQKRVRGPSTIDGMTVDEFIRRNADPIFLHEMEMWAVTETDDGDTSSNARCSEMRMTSDAPREDDEMRPEYDFRGGVRGKYAERYRQHLTALVEREGDGFVSHCPELDITSQGDTADDARANLEEAVELFFEVADDSELRRRSRQ